MADSRAPFSIGALELESLQSEGVLKRNTDAIG
jgi:hypothetical protein